MSIMKFSLWKLSLRTPLAFQHPGTFVSTLLLWLFSWMSKSCLIDNQVPFYINVAGRNHDNMSPGSNIFEHKKIHRITGNQASKSYLKVRCILTSLSILLIYETNGQNLLITVWDQNPIVPARVHFLKLSVDNNWNTHTHTHTHIKIMYLINSRIYYYPTIKNKYSPQNQMCSYSTIVYHSPQIRKSKIRDGRHLMNSTYKSKIYFFCLTGSNILLIATLKIFFLL